MSVREHWINVRVNPEELARIREKQKELGIKLSPTHWYTLFIQIMSCYIFP